MDIRQLRYFVSVIDCKSFTKAASVLRVAQPALGLQIRKLEDELNVKLIVRHSRGAAATEAGMILLQRARAIIDEMDATKSALKDLAPTLGGRVVLGMAPSISAMLAYPLVRSAAAELPNVSLVLVEELSWVLSEWLNSGRLDIAIGYDILQSSNVSGDPVVIDDLFLVQSPSKPAFGPTVPLAALANIELLAPSPPHSMRSVLDYKAAELGIEINIRFEVQSVHVIKELVEQGIGATILPYGAVRRECEQGRLAATRIVDPTIRRTAYLVHSARRPLSNAESALIRLIRDLMKKETRPNSELWQSANLMVPRHNELVRS